MRKYFIIAGINSSIIVGTFFIFSWLILSVYNDLKYKPYPLDKQRILTKLEEINRSGDWGKFCLIMAYSNPEKELEEFISEDNLIEKVLPDNNQDSFGVGVIFVKNKKIVNSVHIPYLRHTPKNLPKRPCYEREYTIKINKDWEYTLVKQNGK